MIREALELLQQTARAEYLKRQQLSRETLAELACQRHLRTGGAA